MNNKFSSDVFTGLDKMGLGNLSNLSLYKSEEKQEVKKQEAKKIPENQIFDRKVQCAVCNNDITVKAVKTSCIRVDSRDSDFMVNYGGPNPLLYDAWFCPKCGYAALSSKFTSLLNNQRKLILENISSKWSFNKSYPSLYDEDTALEIHQLALLNSVVKMAKDSEKALICLKMGWICRIKKDEENEKKYLYQALQGFIRAAENENPPINGLDSPSLDYLIGELYRRLGDQTNALRWFGRVLTSRDAKPKIKDMARDMKDLIREESANGRQVSSC